MVIIVRELNSGGSIIFQSGTVAVGFNVPDIFFRKDSFITNDRPVWTRNRGLDRTGNFAHNNGSDDSIVKAVVVLSNDDRFTNLALVKTIYNQIFFLDASDVDSNVSGQYTIASASRPKASYNPTSGAITVDMLWEAYNN